LFSLSLSLSLSPSAFYSSYFHTSQLFMYTSYCSLSSLTSKSLIIIFHNSDFKCNTQSRFCGWEIEIGLSLCFKLKFSPSLVKCLFYVDKIFLFVFLGFQLLVAFWLHFGCILVAFSLHFGCIFHSPVAGFSLLIFEVS
jgi:hypothetical protein